MSAALAALHNAEMPTEEIADHDRSGLGISPVPKPSIPNPAIRRVDLPAALDNSRAFWRAGGLGKCPRYLEGQGCSRRKSKEKAPPS